MKLKQKTVKKSFMKIRVYLILVTIHKIQFFYPVNEKVISKMEDKFKGKVISAFVRLKSKMYFLVDVYDEENKKQKESIMLLITQDIKNLLMVCLTKN